MAKKYRGGHGEDYCGTKYCKGGCENSQARTQYRKHRQDYSAGVRTVGGHTSILKEEYNGLTIAPESQHVLRVKLDNLNKMNSDAKKTFDQIYPVKKVIDELKSGTANKDPVYRRHLREQMDEYCAKGDRGNADSVLFQLIRALYNHKTDLPKVLWQIKDLPELEKEKDAHHSIQVYLKTFKPNGVA